MNPNTQCTCDKTGGCEVCNTVHYAPTYIPTPELGFQHWQARAEQLYRELEIERTFRIMNELHIENLNNDKKALLDELTRLREAIEKHRETCSRKHWIKNLETRDDVQSLIDQKLYDALKDVK